MHVSAQKCNQYELTDRVAFKVIKIDLGRGERIPCICFPSAPTRFNLSRSNGNLSLLAQRGTTDAVISAQNQRRYAWYKS